jgi:Uma2 family endonuclease
MSELSEFEGDYLDEDTEMGSLNHGIVQTQIVGLLLNDKRFRVIVELSLDTRQIDLGQFGLKAKEELKPDICVYPNTVKRQRRDVLRMSEMPWLAIEIISPSQSIDSLLAKFDAYFQLGVKSCWLVMPSVDIVDVYSQPDQHKTFDMNDMELIDEVMDIHLPIQNIFEW